MGDPIGGGEEPSTDRSSPWGVEPHPVAARGPPGAARGPPGAAPDVTLLGLAEDMVSASPPL